MHLCLYRPPLQTVLSTLEEAPTVKTTTPPPTLLFCSLIVFPQRTVNAFGKTRCVLVQSERLAMRYLEAEGVKSSASFDEPSRNR